MNFTNHDIYDVSTSVKFTYKNIYSLMNNYSSIKYYKLLQLSLHSFTDSSPIMFISFTQQ